MEKSNYKEVSLSKMNFYIHFFHLGFPIASAALNRSIKILKIVANIENEIESFLQGEKCCFRDASKHTLLNEVLNFVVTEDYIMENTRSL